MQIMFKVLSFLFGILMIIPQIKPAIREGEERAKEQNAAQVQRLEAMRNGDIPVTDEQSFANFDINDTEVKYNEVKMLATHNSYKRSLSDNLYQLSRPIVGDDLCKQFLYEHNTLVTQLGNGVRGLELDMRWQTDGFKIFHFPYVDNGSNSPDFKMTLEELALWSNANPNHVPVTVLIELRNDIPYMNSKFQKMDADKFKELDNLILSMLGENKVATPAELMGAYPSLAAMVKNNGWPMLNSLEGKFIFLLHPDTTYTDTYINRDKTLRTQVLVPAFWYYEALQYYNYAAFIISNDPELDPIKAFTSRHYMVRTRMDDQLVYDAAQKESALASGAQILSTDLEKDTIRPKLDYTATLEDNYTVVLGK